ncbi:MAG: radical SAM protein [Alphaproteobacteria bacterium]|nr:radical SAM protein [Alphaproteobacteria bacterium]
MVALVFPPGWYYPTVPVDLTVTAGGLREAGVDVTLHDLNAAGAEHLLGAPYRALSTEDGWADVDAHVAAISERETEVSAAHHVRWAWPGEPTWREDTGDLRVALELVARNPYAGASDLAPLLGATVVALAWVHPGQLVPLLGLVQELREAGYAGRIVVYGGLEDVLEPRSLALTPDHALFDVVDAVLLGDPVPTLAALARGERPTAGLLSRSGAVDAVPSRLYAPVFDGLSTLYGTFEPVVDVRWSVGCSWDRCTFCAIPAHHRYRLQPLESLVTGMERAEAALGTRRFRFRDDLVSPAQSDRLVAALAGRGWHWLHRARFDAGWTVERLRAARAAGLSEIWFGLESAVPRVRELVDKGVPPDVVEANLAACAEAGIRARMLVIGGLPGETSEEFAETVRFLHAQRGRICGFALTAFQLMRDASVARSDLVERLDDPVPARHRLRWTVPFAYRDGTSATVWQNRVSSALFGFMEWPSGAAALGPTHAWVESTRP